MPSNASLVPKLGVFREEDCPLHALEVSSGIGMTRVPYFGILLYFGVYLYSSCIYTTHGGSILTKKVYMV